MNRLRALWPRKMLHQLSALLLLALLASNVIAIVFVQHTGALIHPLSRTMSLERLVTAHHVAMEAKDEVFDRLLGAITSADARFWISTQADVEPFAMRAEEQRMASALREQLQLPQDVRVAMQLERVSGDHACAHALPSLEESARTKTSRDLCIINSFSHAWEIEVSHKPLPITTPSALTKALSALIRCRACSAIGPVRP